MQFIIKFFPEITIKSKPVRKQMVKRLRDNLFSVLRPLDGKVTIANDWDKLVVELSPEGEALKDEFIEVLSNSGGIAYFLEVETHDFSGLDDIAVKTFDYYQGQLSGKTFVVRCKRSGKHEFTSHDIERYVGGYILKQGIAKGVDLHTPDVTVAIEVRGEKLHVIKKRYKGQGGFPLGEVEPVLSLISGGFDSPVASFLTMKRGMPTHFCFFNLGGKDHELGVKEVAYYLWQKYGMNRRVKFVAVPFEGVVAEILKNVENSQMGVILKRMMLRAASRVAEELEVKALVTGEAVAQVSSQTLTNLTIIDSVTETLVLRPLIASDKEDIIRVARQIGTEEFAASMPEYCGVISVKPTTRARDYRIEREEANFDFAVLDQAFEDAQWINIDEIALEENTRVEVESFEVPLPDSVIIDVRHADEIERKPLTVSGQTVQAIPFYQLHKAFAELDKSKKYLLYCDKGVMSKLHASHLVDEGYDVAVYRPPQ